jgi:hypothetical protein
MTTGGPWRIRAILVASLLTGGGCRGLAPQPAPALSYFVSPSGDDAGPGTRENPFRTIERARAAVQTVNRAMTSDIVVYLRAGTYPISRPLAFGPADSGFNGYQVRYEAYGHEVPVVSGGVRVTG